jgi:hypothetical protein
MSPDPEGLLARLREICLALPETAERLSHGEPGFHIVKGKFFAYFSHNHHNDGITAVHVKTSGMDEQAMLIEAEPEVYYRPPYLGPSGWVGIRLDTDEIDWDQVADRVAYSWELIAPRRLLEMGGR